MMTQSVITQAANLFGSTTGNVTSKGKQAGNGFDQMIDNSLKAVKDSKWKTEPAAAKKTSLQDARSQNNVQSDDAGQMDDKAQKMNVVTKNDTAKTTEQTTTKQTVKTNNAAEVKEDETGKTDDLTVNEQVMVQIADMLQSIKEAVMDILNLSSEELDQLLAEQGMTMADLLQTENLQQLVIANNDESNILAALTDENLADTMKQLLQTVDEIKAGSNLGLTEEQLTSILEQVKKQGEAQTETSGNVADLSGQVSPKDVLSKNSEAVNTTGTTEEDRISGKLEEGKNLQTENSKLTDTKDTSSETNSDSGNNTDDLKAQDQFQTFIDNLVKVTSDTQVSFNGSLEQVTELRDIANQIIQRIRVSVTPDQTSMELHLNPENLGKVNFSVQSKNGVMTAQFVVQNEISKEAIESQLQTLRETLNQQGIKVEAIEVTVSAYAFEQNSGEGSENQTNEQKNQSGKKISLEEAIQMSEIPDSEQELQDITGISGSQVDYIA
jgi:flagellar hook-length control protein FliK